MAKKSILSGVSQVLNPKNSGPENVLNRLTNVPQADLRAPLQIDVEKYTRFAPNKNVPTYADPDYIQDIGANYQGNLRRNLSFLPRMTTTALFEVGQMVATPLDFVLGRFFNNDPYSTSNGLRKTGSVLEVIATGGLVANTSGVYIQDIADVAGAYGSANSVPVFTVNTKGQIVDVDSVALVADSAQTITGDYVQQIQGTTGSIRVLNGTGNASNVTLDLTATGVTAATYGNATHTPRITVDSYGRVQNIDLVKIVGGGSGNANVSAGISGKGHTHTDTAGIGAGTTRKKKEGDNMTHEMIVSLFETYNEENEKFVKGNKAAGTRARKAFCRRCI